MPIGQPIIKGNTNIIWGTNGVLASGVIKSARRSSIVEETQVPNNVGLTHAYVLLVDGKEVEFELECRSNVNLPSEGDDITVLGVSDCTVCKVEENWEQKGIKNARVTVKKFLHLGEDGTP